MTSTPCAPPHSLFEFISSGGKPSELSSDERWGLLDLLGEIGSFRLPTDLQGDAAADDLAPYLVAVLHPDPSTPRLDQWEMELTFLPQLRATINDLLTFEMLS